MYCRIVFGIFCLLLTLVICILPSQVSNNVTEILESLVFRWVCVSVGHPNFINREAWWVGAMGLTREDYKGAGPCEGPVSGITSDPGILMLQHNNVPTLHWSPWPLFLFFIEFLGFAPSNIKKDFGCWRESSLKNILHVGNGYVGGQ